MSIDPGAAAAGPAAVGPAAGEGGLEVVSGSPDELELAALLAVSTAAAAAAGEVAPDDDSAPSSEWSLRARACRAPHTKIAGTTSNDWRWSLRG